MEDFGIFLDLKKVIDFLSKSFWVNWNSNELMVVFLLSD